MAANAVFALIALLALSTASLAPTGGEAKAVAAAPTPPQFSCSDAVSALIPCGSYLLGSGGNLPTKACCQSAQKLNKAAATKADRQALCKCLEQLGPSFGVKPEFATRLPTYCKLQLKIPISTNADCTQFESLSLSLSLEHKIIGREERVLNKR